MRIYYFTVIGYKCGDKRIVVRFLSAPSYSDALTFLDDILYNIEMWDSYYVYSCETK